MAVREQKKAHMKTTTAFQPAMPGFTRKQPPTMQGDKTVFHDPSFAKNKVYPLHRWVPWIAGFSREFVYNILRMYMHHDTGTVLDPFAGVGTTLVETILHGHTAIGFEINPYACMACNVKVHAHKVSSQDVQREIEKFQSFYTNKVFSDYVPYSKPPVGFKTKTDFFSPLVLRKVLIVHDFINAIEDSKMRDLFKLAFATTMVNFSNYSYEPSLGRRSSADKEDVTDFLVDREIVSKLLQMVEDIAWFQVSLPNKNPETTIFNCSFLEYSYYIPPNSIDIIITSPPYLNNYHYNRNTRPQLYWLGYVAKPQDMKPLEFANFGKYWQTVRTCDDMELEFSLPSTDIMERLNAIRQINPDRGVYGGRGWANYAVAYFNDCYRLVHIFKEVLKPKGTALIVLGNSILQGIVVPTDVYFGEIAALAGLEVVQIDTPRNSRVGSSIIHSRVRIGKATDAHRLYESVIELRKL